MTESNPKTYPAIRVAVPEQLNILEAYTPDALMPTHRQQPTLARAETLPGQV